jgi:hypothetical protein
MRSHQNVEVINTMAVNELTFIIRFSWYVPNHIQTNKSYIKIKSKTKMTFFCCCIASTEEIIMKFERNFDILANKQLKSKRKSKFLFQHQNQNSGKSKHRNFNEIRIKFCRNFDFVASTVSAKKPAHVRKSIAILYTYVSTLFKGLYLYNFYRMLLVHRA